MVFSVLQKWRLALRLAVVMIAAVLPGIGQGEPLVGAYYYPWYGSFSGGHPWNQAMRKHLSPAQPPALGYYSSRDSATIAAHIDQSHRANISFWAISWWGPGSADDKTTHDYIFAHPRAGELKYGVH